MDSSEDATAVTLDMPGSLADFFADLDLEEPERTAYNDGRVIDRGTGYSLRITAPVEVHRLFLERCWVLSGGPGIDTSPGERNAHRNYRVRIERAEADVKRSERNERR